MQSGPIRNRTRQLLGDAKMTTVLLAQSPELDAR
jgi:hypothetical protein